MKNTRHLIFLFVASFTLFFQASAAYSESDPIALLQTVANKMIAGLKANQATLKNKPQIVYHLAYQYVVPNADLPTMSKHVLPPQTWNHATANQRAQFQKEFTTILIRTYASALTSYRDQTVHFYPLRGSSKNSVEVKSEIQSPSSDPIQVSYRLVRCGNAWKLYDLSVEGVSMLESFRSQFSDILAQSNMDQLLQRMSAHNAHR